MHGLLTTIKTCVAVLLIGGVGLLFSQTSPGLYLEEEFGLEWLFRLRGPVKPPQEVVIVAIDQLSSEILHLPDDPETWPRSYYARLVEKLNAYNPAIIAFNIHFGESRDSTHDATLADAIAKNKNVILSNYLKQYTVPAKPPLDEIRYEKVIDPIPELSMAALATAPFPLPRSASTVKEFWTYKHSAGDIPTFPACVFQYYAIKETYPELKTLLEKMSVPVISPLPESFDLLNRQYKAIQVFNDIHTGLTQDDLVFSEFANSVEESDYPVKTKRLLQSWLSLIKSEERLFLNYYGDIGTIKTVPYYQALAADILAPDLFNNKIVLVGYSETIEPEKNRGFYNVYSRISGNIISPIEIAATAIANIIDQSWLRPVPMKIQGLIILGWGILLSGIFRIFSYKKSMIFAGLLIFAYLQFTLFEFSNENIWLPLAIPMLQAASVLLVQTVNHLFKISRVSECYIPKEVFAFNTFNPDAMNDYGVLTQGVCLATDAGQYTSLSETINPLQLNKLMNDYYAAIFPFVKNRQGLVTDVIGDAMLAVWAKNNDKHDRKLRLNACLAALDIKNSIEQFNEQSQYYLATRMGLHFGDMRLGNVGAAQHYEYRAVGDTINTATRIEGLNKLLGTRILVSAQVIEGLSEFSVRELGSFLLKGKSQTVTLFELIGSQSTADIDSAGTKLTVRFGQAYQAFKSQRWQEALSAFALLAGDYPEDGPTQFYLNYLKNQLSLDQDSSKERAVIIDVGKITGLLQ
jgi:adenylate cyclase